MKIKVKVFLMVFISSLLVFSLIISYLLSVYRTYSLNDAKKQIVQHNTDAAGVISTLLEKDLSVCATIADNFTNYTKIPKSFQPDLYKNILQTTLEEHDEYLSTWLTMELGFIDKNYSLNYGRQRIAAIKQMGLTKFYIDSLDLKGDNVESLYYKSKQSKLDILSNPYYYRYSKELRDSVLETSIAAPIIIDNKFAGLVGVDIELERFSRLTKDSKPFDESEIYLLSSTGEIISSSSDNVKNMDKLNNLYPELTELNVLSKILHGQRFSHSFTDSLNTNYFAAFEPITVGSSNSSWSICLILPQNSLEKQFTNVLLQSIGIGIAGVLLISLIAFLVSSRISVSINEVSSVLNDLSKGVIDIPKQLESKKGKDEIANMNASVNKLINTLQKTTKFAKRIGSGDFSASSVKVTEEDVLGNALLDMQKNLKLGQEQEIERQKEREKLSWTQKGLTELGELLRTSNEGFEEYLLSILRYMLKFFKAEQGAIFLLNTSDRQNPFLELRAAYAYDKKKSLEARVEIGENVVGRCFQEKETIYMTNIPKGYTFVSSGLGSHQPKCLFLMPLIFEDEVLGVVEIASFRELEEFERDFLEIVGERVASSISAVEKNFETQTLLNQYKAKSLELANVETILENNKQELSKAKLNAQNYELENNVATDAIADFATVSLLGLDNRVIKVKDKSMEEKGYTQIEMIRRQQSALISLKHSKSREFKNLWEALLKGEEQTLTRHYIFKNNKVKVIEIFKPIKDSEGKITKILNVTLDYGRLD